MVLEGATSSRGIACCLHCGLLIIQRGLLIIYFVAHSSSGFVQHLCCQRLIISSASWFVEPWILHLILGYFNIAISHYRILGPDECPVSDVVVMLWDLDTSVGRDRRGDEFDKLNSALGRICVETLGEYGHNSHFAKLEGQLQKRKACAPLTCTGHRLLPYIIELEHVTVRCVLGLAIDCAKITCKKSGNYFLVWTHIRNSFRVETAPALNVKSLCVRCNHAGRENEEGAPNAICRDCWQLQRIPGPLNSGERILAFE